MPRSPLAEHWRSKWETPPLSTGINFQAPVKRASRIPRPPVDSTGTPFRRQLRSRAVLRLRLRPGGIPPLDLISLSTRLPERRPLPAAALTSHNIRKLKLLLL